MKTQIINFSIYGSVGRDESLQLSRIDLNPDYKSFWNETKSDFVCLTQNGELVSNSLYRVGGFGANLKKDYFLLLKYVESFYEDSITKDKNKKRHLSGHWTIIDKNGIEKKVFEQFKSPYLVKDSCIYCLDQEYFNIETGVFYCRSYTRMESDSFLFLNDEFNEDKNKRGVLKINKKDGSLELIK